MPEFAGEPEPDRGESGLSGPENHFQNLEAKYLVPRIRTIRLDSHNFFVLRKFESLALEKSGLLPALEGAGVVPLVPENPNPFNVVLQEEQHEHWWEEHLEESEEFRGALEKRPETLRTLYIGTRLRHLTGKKMYRWVDMPPQLTRDELTRFFAQHYRWSLNRFIMENAFEQCGISLAALEKAGVVPTVQPIPEEKLQYGKRSESLAHLNIGVLVDRLLDEIAARKK